MNDTLKTDKTEQRSMKFYVGTAFVMFALVGLMIALPQNASASGFRGEEGCTLGYWKNHADTNPRVAELEGINLNVAILDITGLVLGAPDDLTIGEAVELKGGKLNALYRQAAAGVFNYFYGDPTAGDFIVYIPIADFTGFIQQALDGDVSGAVDAIDAANNLGCPINSFGVFER